jgi:hypothetical protein
VPQDASIRSWDQVEEEGAPYFFSSCVRSDTADRHLGVRMQTNGQELCVLCIREFKREIRKMGTRTKKKKKKKA